MKTHFHMKGYAPKLALKKRYKPTRKWPIKIGEEHRSNSAFKRNLIDFLGLNDQAKKSGLGLFDLKLYRLVKISGKTENYSISASDSHIEPPFPPGNRA